MISQLSRPSQPGEHLLHHEHLGIPVASDHLDPDVLGVAMELDVEGRVTNADVAYSLEATMSGVTLTEYREKDKLIPVVLRSHAARDRQAVLFVADIPMPAGGPDLEIRLVSGLFMKQGYGLYSPTTWLNFSYPTNMV